MNHPIQICDGKLCCPYCAGDIQADAGYGVGQATIIPLFRCNDCDKCMGLMIHSCAPGEHTHIRWVEPPPNLKPDTDKTLN